MWYVRSKLISEWGIKRDRNSGIPEKSMWEFSGKSYTGIRESKWELLQYSSRGRKTREECVRDDMDEL